MPCYYPVKCWRHLEPNSKGSRPLIHASNLADARKKSQTTLITDAVRPCGYCTGCRLEKARQVAMRCAHQASLHDKNSFLTLTYNAEHLPKNLSISTDHLQKFWKKFRDRLNYPDIKYYAAGEYGTEKNRPHYHACLFGWDFSDKSNPKKSGSGQQIYTSALLDEIWGMGNCWVGTVTFESACYVARYTMDKRYGKDADEYYRSRGIEPERSWSSKGLAKEWFERYKGDCYPKDYVTFRGQKMRPPAYYDRLLLRDDPVLLAELKVNRENHAKLNKSKINLELADVGAMNESLYRQGYRSVLGRAIKPVAEIVQGASMHVGGLDNER